jgi:formamidopyrimidine-DNA glycosylase
MPELPEVEAAAEQLRGAVLGRVVARVRVLHPTHRRQLPPGAQRALAGRRIDRIERRAKIQLVHFDDDSVLEVHFRMTGDWAFTRGETDAPAHARLRLEMTDGVVVHLVDSRALAVVRRHAPGTWAPPPLGPEPLTDDFTTDGFGAVLASRRAPIKTVLLDQRVVAGVGNIYAAEALWVARIHPATPAQALSMARVRRLRDAIREVLQQAPTGRYYARVGADAVEAWRVYDAEGGACPRCRTSIARLVQGGRSSYYCPRCQRR